MKKLLHDFNLEQLCIDEGNLAKCNYKIIDLERLRITLERNGSTEQDRAENYLELTRFGNIMKSCLNFVTETKTWLH